MVHVGLGAHSRGPELIRACTVSRCIYRDLHPNAHLQEWPEAAQRMCPEEGFGMWRETSSLESRASQSFGICPRGGILA